MKKLTIGKRIVLGFALLILIAVLLGGFAVIQMRKSQAGAYEMAKAYVPEVDIASEIERNVLLSMYNNRGYAYSEEKAYFEAGQAFLASSQEQLDEARQLAKDYQLDGMLEAEPRIRQGLQAYGDLSVRSSEVVARMQQLRQKMDTHAAQFVAASRNMSEQHERGTARDLEERSFKVRKSEQVMQKGNQARVANFRAQATGDMSLFDTAVESLNESLAALESLAPVTRDADDIALLDGLRTAIRDYQTAIREFASETGRGEEASASRLALLRQKMDMSAGKFTELSDTYFQGQLKKMNDNITERVTKLSWVGDILNLGNNARVSNFKAQTLREAEEMDKAILLIRDIDQIHAQLEPTIHTAEGKANLKATMEATRGYQQAMEAYQVAFRELEKLNQQRGQVAEKALQDAQQLAALGMGQVTEIADTSHENLATASGLMVFGLLGATGIGSLLALFITRSITRPLHEAINQLSSGASETGSAAAQVSSASQSLAEGASEQAASLEETSSSMEEMTSMVARNAEVARTTNDHAKQASQAANDGVRSVGELRQRADAVSVSAQEMEAAMQAIKQSSDSISKIIKTIDEIAFQTNILALNAAVEAARAGEAGAGFAVVADEVRSLARRAAEAAQETASMIEDSMERSERGVQVNATVGRNLKEVLEKAMQVENGLKSISAVVGEVNGAMDELEASVREQQDGIGQINTAITQVNEVTQGNAASAEEAASAAEEMNAQSVNLSDIVGLLTDVVATT